MKQQLNTASRICAYAERIANCAINGTEWDVIARTLDHLQEKTLAACAYVRDCIAHARQIAYGQPDSTDSRSEIYADMELLEIYILSH